MPTVAPSLPMGYRSLLERRAGRRPPPQRPGDWRVTLFILPSAAPETILDLGVTGGVGWIERTVFRRPLWDAFLGGGPVSGPGSPPAARTRAALPPSALARRLVESGLFLRLPGVPVGGVVGETLAAVFRNPGGIIRRETWDAQAAEWATLVEAALLAATTPGGDGNVSGFQR